MRSRSSVVRVSPRPAPTATHIVTFEKRKRQSHAAPIGRIPRVTRLLALAHGIDNKIRAGEIRDWAKAARLVGVTRARMTQIANLLLLAPQIQEVLLDVHAPRQGRDRLTEHRLRGVVSAVDWRAQERQSAPIDRFLTAARPD